MEITNMEPFIRSVQYYETDMMGITHHANYIHWMEEARVDFMNQIGFPYRKMESLGVISPVLEVSCKYKKPCTFGDKITVSITVETFSEVKLVLSYDMRNNEGEIVCTAKSEHTFLSKDGRFARLKRDVPEFYTVMENLLQNGSKHSKE